jgi:type II secretory pathway component GspD/PulD (secretin)
VGSFDGRRTRAVAGALLLAAGFVTSGVLAPPAPAAPAGPVAAPRRIQLNAHDEPVRDVLLRIGELAHLSIVINDDVRGNVNLTLHDASADEAIRAVCVQARLRCAREGRTVSVSAESSAVVPLAIVPAARAANVLRTMYPRLGVRADPAGNALVLSGAASDIASARAILQGLDVRDPSKPTSEAITLRSPTAAMVAERLRALYPAAKITVISRTTMLVSATPPDMTQIKGLIGGIDAPTAAPTTIPVASEAVKVSQRRPQDVARAVSAQIPRVHAAVSGSAVALSGSPEDVTRAKALIAQIDVPAYGARYVQIYRIKNVDASSVADLIKRSFPDALVTVDASLNALSVVAAAADHQRIAEGIARLDGTAASSSTGEPGNVVIGGGVANGHEIVQLQSIVPNQGYGTSTTAQDIASAVQSALQVTAPDLRVIVPNGMTSVILTGSPTSIRAAKELIAELDTIPQSVVLDTEILELDESSSRNLGLQLGTTSIGTTFSEIQPTPDPNSGQPGRLIAFQPLTRTALQFQAQINLLIQNGKARVLADPRITTVSGRTATIRAGDSISILTTVGGGSGTVATTQLQTFNTGVTLDITPIITLNGDVNVALHPVVNSLSGFLNNVPQIATRDTQTSVHLHDNETLVIGGLIQESTQSQESRLPILGNLPIIGRAFRNQNTTSTRNELIIVVTPHVLKGNEATTVPNAAGPPGMAIPTPRPLPTLPPQTRFPAASATAPPAAAPARTAAPSVSASRKPSVSGSPVPDASAAASPAASPAGSASPAATPTAFAQANVYVFGSPPPSTYAGPNDAPQIFWAQLQPTVITPNATVRVNVIATTNVQKVTIGTASTKIGLSPLGSGTWQGVFSANNLQLPSTATTLQLTLTASRNDGQSASIQLPVSLMRGETVL